MAQIALDEFFHSNSAFLEFNCFLVCWVPVAPQDVKDMGIKSENAMPQSRPTPDAACLNKVASTIVRLLTEWLTNQLHCKKAL